MPNSDWLSAVGPLSPSVLKKGAGTVDWIAYVYWRRDKVEFENRGKRFATYELKSEAVLIDCGTNPGPSSALFLLRYVSFNDKVTFSLGHISSLKERHLRQKECEDR